VTQRHAIDGGQWNAPPRAIVLGGGASAREYIQRLGRVLRKVENQEAVLFEVVARNTLDEGRAQRRQPRPEAL
jgi:superfamily II DNA or RNA helicase